ncbi:low temperature requirement protein A [Brevundimonas nasdae]|jgi:low temperature requirement protein LtrA|uniref:Low temperature requirement protein A n=1 Tax=Brevundimonas nasdae TaxID=172043 RepID=A0ABX8TKK4_9CAUL|nr:low temperature requirement protein A [Brevundimonas nasdae]QYC11539.1 low temperature requirement protein A [Brevundimonas nasdae]QYC14327.1 low temperature requirement protein A [Brevundimonas nasdae]
MASLLRKRVKGEHARVGFVELFFDLVFVFAITQVSHGLLAHLTPLGAVQAAMLLAAVWWAWIFTSWMTNWLDPETVPVQAALFVLMGIGLVMSASLPHAFQETGLSFALAFVGIQVGRTAFMVWAMRADEGLRRNAVRILIWLTASAVLWIAGGLAAPEQRLWFWLAALAVEYASPALYFFVPGLGRSRTEDWTIEGGHMAERVGLFVIICLGETLLVSGATFGELDWSSAKVWAAFISAILSTVAMWRLFFSQAHESASEAIMHAADPGRVARRAYTYSPILVIAGIIVVAVSDELVLAHPSGHVSMATALTLLGGPILFLLGTAVAGWAIWRHVNWTRLVGCAVLATGWLVVPWTTPLTLSIATTIVLMAIGVWESLRPPQV